MLRRARLAWVLLATVFAGAGCTESNQGGGTEPLKSMQAQCFGRHQGNLPHSFRFSRAGSSVMFYYGHDADFETVEFAVAAEDLEAENFGRSLGRRAAEISGEINEKTNGSMLLANEGIGTETVLLRYHKSDISDLSHVHEVHRLVDGVHVFLRAESYDGVMEGVELRLKNLAAKVEPISSVAPDAGRFCFGPVSIEAGNDYELAIIRYRDSEWVHRDVFLQVEVNTFKRDEAAPRLLQRLGRNFGGFGFKPHVIRKGEAQLGGVPAEEWLGRERVDQSVEHLFVVESYPDSPALGSPALQVTLRTGGRVPDQRVSGLPPYRRSTSDARPPEESVTSSLTDAQAIALWDAVVGSVRPR